MNTPVQARGVRRTISIVPDSLFTLKLNHKEYSYFLEIDRGTEDLSRLTNRARAYANLFADRTPQQRFGIRSFRVLFVTISRTRIENLVERLLKLGQGMSRLDLICFTDFDSCSLASPG